MFSGWAAQALAEQMGRDWTGSALVAAAADSQAYPCTSCGDVGCQRRMSKGFRHCQRETSENDQTDAGHHEGHVAAGEGQRLDGRRRLGYGCCRRRNRWLAGVGG